ncbi:LPS export ABC transporter permease LptF [Sphingopyxis sp. H038]|nr:LPS export ABC transporter permease LptF [Sphingopyxis sp. H012]KTE05334.1 LPS export ABC transporter permease LptF [Sphingopyxis sp. H093]KTE12824.1 LPS export ABC transporter permease LptF [Sphingopyxis sp. H053]KTE24318.1 LPS export ABC transporter permease LptF [Sphingopyxis sp. H080]KTE34893.1 LPS export ABC transporter permease LptF [Sphingopyxis sp. H038]KTE38733.1 LPS export ABC transporter permease LptF [Sphingopyxis sp. H005]KTE46753.1 LPS export ABC transporter permease LptF [Sp
MLGTLVLSAMLLVLEKMLRLFDFVATEGGPVSVVWRMLANLIPEYLSLGIPIGLMLGILLAFRRLATSSELDVLKGVGMSFGRLMRVPFAYAIALAALNLAIVGFIQPVARYAYEGLQFELRSGALGASIKVGEFTKLGDRMTLRIEESYNDGRSLRGIFVRGEQKDGQRVSATAARGQFLATDDPNTIILRLSQGVLIHESPKFSVPRVLTFDNHDLPIPLPKIEAFRLRGGADREMTIPELFVAGKDKSQSVQTRLESRANFHFRIVEVMSMFLIPLIAIALAIPPKRSTSSLGVFLSIVLLVTQHKINQYAEDMGARGVVDPLIALWVPYLLFAALAIWMYYVVAHVPGGQPIGALERVAAKAAQKIRKMLTMFQRKPGLVESVN